MLGWLVVFNVKLEQRIGILPMVRDSSRKMIWTHTLKNILPLLPRISILSLKKVVPCHPYKYLLSLQESSTQIQDHFPRLSLADKEENIGRRERKRGFGREKPSWGNS